MFDLTVIPVPYETFPPADAEAIARAEAALSLSMPDDLRRFLRQTNGLVVEDYGQVVEGTAGLVEMNEAFHVRERLPGFLHIGTDGGGCAILLAADGAVMRCEHGSLGLLPPTPVAETFAAWAAGGFRLPAFEQPGVDWSAPADVTLVSPPAGGLKDLAAIRAALSLEVGLGELKSLAERLPAVLPTSLTYGQATKRLERLGPEAACLKVTPQASDTKP